MPSLPCSGSRLYPRSGVQAFSSDGGAHFLPGPRWALLPSSCLWPSGSPMGEQAGGETGRAGVQGCSDPPVPGSRGKEQTGTSSRKKRGGCGGNEPCPRGTASGGGSTSRGGAAARAFEAVAVTQAPVSVSPSCPWVLRLMVSGEHRGTWAFARLAFCGAVPRDGYTSTPPGARFLVPAEHDGVCFLKCQVDSQ